MWITLSKKYGIIIVDEFTGRLMPGRRYSHGLHQAIEAKEGVEVQRESKRRWLPSSRSRTTSVCTKTRRYDGNRQDRKEEQPNPSTS